MRFLNCELLIKNAGEVDNLSLDAEDHLENYGIKATGDDYFVAVEVGNLEDAIRLLTDADMLHAEYNDVDFVKEIKAELKGQL